MGRPIQIKNRYRTGDNSDVRVWSAVLEGDRDAFELLFHRHYDDLFHYALKLTGQKGMAKDHVQKLFLYVWQKRDTLDEVEAVRTYLWTSLRRSIIDTYRKKQAERKYLDKFADSRLKMQFSAEELIINNEESSIRHSELKKAIDQLSSRQREVLYLKFYEGMSYQEIEQIMDVNYQTCRNYIYRAIESLRALLRTEVLVGVIIAGLLHLI
ncbi:RNA polymerase sigma factor [Fodinibius salsisoli]|uniref:RNA polymerase sigma factor n=1 Tax=Fodinibius salsisoli TaxID=2820877 RepID=A0ABT3PKS9_9BACT|nr:RNA polymerase sigma factor [Fodinibius salsisoli]MCW9706517.1 RNA polymerase sigma factor [Fodinibius salsisoli]